MKKMKTYVSSYTNPTNGCQAMYFRDGNDKNGNPVYRVAVLRDGQDAELVRVISYNIEEQLKTLTEGA